MGNDEAILALGISTVKGWSGIFIANTDDKRALVIAFLEDNGIHVREKHEKVNGSTLPNSKYVEPSGWESAYLLISTKPAPNSFKDLAPHFQRAVIEKLQQKG